MTRGTLEAAGPAVVHATAVVDSGAQLGAGAEIGPFCVIGPGAVLGARVRVGPHCVIDGRTELGDGCVLTAHVSLGAPPQDLKYAGEPTGLRIGAGNTLREFVTVHRGTAGGGGMTVIGDQNLLMTGAHVAHDCRVGSHAVFANSATLAGHVQVGDWATVGAFSAVHQFCRVGRHAFVGGFTVMTQDVLPFMKTVGSRGEVKAFGANRIGLERRGFAPEVIEALQGAFRILHGKQGRSPASLERMRREWGHVAEVAELAEFIAHARQHRGFHS